MVKNACVTLVYLQIYHNIPVLEYASFVFCTNSFLYNALVGHFYFAS